MGKAIIITNADFSEINIGTVHFLQDVPVQSLNIVAQSSITAKEFTPTVTYIPSDTSQIGVKWSITSGSTYASINETTGKVTIKQNASNNNITIKATSIYDNTISATKTITVTYESSSSELQSITLNATKTERNTYRLDVTYNPSDPELEGVVYTVTSGNEYISLSDNVFTVKSTVTEQQSVTIRATSTVKPSVNDSVTLSVIYEDVPTWNLKTKIGAIEGVNSGLFDAMTKNKCTIMTKFSDDSTVVGSSNGVVFAFGGEGVSPFAGYKSHGPGIFISFRKYALFTANALYGSGWTAGATSGAKNVTQNEYQFTIDTAPSDDIGGKAYIMTQDNDSIGVMYIDGVDAGTPYRTTQQIQYLKYITFGWESRPQSSAGDYNTCEELYNTVGINTTTTDGALKTIKLSNFIIVPGTYTTESEVLAARSNALVDIQFENDGTPYNAGSTGTLMLMDAPA